MDFLEHVLNAVLFTYWMIIDSFSKIANAYTDVASAKWLTTLCGQLQNICTEKIMPAFAGVGIAIAATYFLISIISLVTEDRLTPEFLAKFFAKLAISVAVIMWSDTILIAIEDFGNALSNTLVNWTVDDFFASNTNSSGSAYNNAFANFADTFINTAADTYNFKWSGSYWGGYDFKETGDTVGFIGALGAGIMIMLNATVLTLISLIVTPIMNAVVYFVEISRTMEFYIRGSLLPMAAGVMADDGWRGAGGRYIKKLLALASQKVVLSLTCVMTAAMATNYIMNELTSCAGKDVIAFIGCSVSIIITALVITFAGLSFMFKSLQVVNDLWGAS